MDHCPICSSHLQLIIQQLSTSAQHSIFNTKDEGSVDATNEDHNSDKPPKLADEKEDKLAAKIEEINLNISALKIPEPQSIKHPDIQISTELPVAKQSRPPHCKTCGHPTKGHQTIYTGRKCLQYPNQECSSANKDTKCLCEWHQKSSSQPKPAKYHYQTENIKYNTTTEFILFNELCQFS